MSPERNRSFASPNVLPPEREVPLGERIITEALKWEGYPSVKYRSPEQGRSPETGFDCSGFVTFVLHEVGVGLPDIRHTNEYFDAYGIYVHDPKPGDLIFFSKKGYAPTHMGFVYDQDHFIQAPGHDHRVVEVTKWLTAPPTGSGEHRIYTRNPIGFKRPALKTHRWHTL